MAKETHVAADKKRDKRIKQAIEEVKRLKSKELGNVKMKGVDKPKTKKQIDDSKRKKMSGSQTAVGPRGGEFKQTSTGKKDYSGLGKKGTIKKALESLVEMQDRIELFVANYLTQKDAENED